MSFSKMPRVLGLVTITAAVRSERAAPRASRSMHPSGPDGTSITVNPAMAALAGFVPWAESGTITSVRGCPLRAWYALAISMPVNSPWAPAAGCRVTASMPEMAQRAFSSSRISRNAPWIESSSWQGCTDATVGREERRSAYLGLYFIVHEPRGYIPLSTPKLIWDRST